MAPLQIHEDRDYVHRASRHRCDLLDGHWSVAEAILKAVDGFEIVHGYLFDGLSSRGFDFDECG